jgi:hypothetical protein
VTAGSDSLERSRLAILEHLHRKEQRRQGRNPNNGNAHGNAQANNVHAHAAGDAGGPQAADEGMWESHRRAHPPGAGGWFETARDVLQDWWKYHPAHMAVDIARPALSSYARRKPMQYLGLAALAGAGLFFLRPWKLISVTGVLVAVARSPHVAELVMRAMSSSENPQGDEPVDE